jgi:hypothetical protein
MSRAPATTDSVPPGWVLVNGVWQPEPAQARLFPVQVRGFCPPKDSKPNNAQDK